jgi:hypothetical protein
MDKLLYFLNPIILIPTTICACIVIGLIGEVALKIIKALKG